jgi:hypothetical protein
VAARLTSITYERDGFPCHLATDREWRDAIARGSLRPDSRVTVCREGAKDQLREASAIPELQSLFDEAAMSSPEGTLAIIRKLVEERVKAGLAEAAAAAEGLRERVETQEKRISALELELVELRSIKAGAAPLPPARGVTPAAQPAPAPARPSGAQLSGDLAEYLRLLELPAPKPRQFKEAFELLGPAGFLEAADAGRFIVKPSYGADALAIAFPRNSAFIALPGFAFVSMYDKAYRLRRNVPPMIAALFELVGGDRLELKRPAELRPGTDNTIELITRGCLGGFAD